MTFDELYISSLELALQLQGNLKIMRSEILKHQGMNIELQNKLRVAEARIRELEESNGD